jgi:hypothetical protein
MSTACLDNANNASRKSYKPVTSPAGAGVNDTGKKCVSNLNKRLRFICFGGFYWWLSGGFSVLNRSNDPNVASFPMRPWQVFRIAFVHQGVGASGTHRYY